jgi:hypothetical protein
VILQREEGKERERKGIKNTGYSGKPRASKGAPKTAFRKGRGKL